MRFEPQPCAEFPNDNPELHDGALWVSGFCRARPRAIISAESVARVVARETAVAELSARLVARETAVAELSARVEAVRVETLPEPLVESSTAVVPVAGVLVAALPEPAGIELLAEPAMELAAVPESLPAFEALPEPAELEAVPEPLPAFEALPEPTEFEALPEPVAEMWEPSLEVSASEAEEISCAADIAEAAVESVFARLDDVFAAEDFSATPPPLNVEVAEVVGAADFDFGTLELEPEHVASVVAELDELFEAPPDEWQTPVSAVELRLPDVNVAEVAPFRVPRPELFGNIADEPASLFGAALSELEPLSLDLTPPPPGVAGWAQLSALIATFLLERGATRAAALLPQLLEGRRPKLERLSEETRRCLCEANIAETTTEGCWPTADFQRQAAALYLDHKNGQARDVLRWVSDVVRALLANNMSHAAIRAHLEEAGVKALLSRAA